MSKQKLIGFIGQGWIGKNYADDYKARGFEIVRYDTKKFAKNKDKIKNCDIVYIAVPTPSTPKGFDYSIVESVLSLIGEDKIAIIKSTILPGTTDTLQKKFPKINLMHSPEFLTEKTAKFDVANPCRNILGVTEKSKSKAGEVMITLPPAPYEEIMPAMAAELLKYGGNCWFYFKVIYVNMLFDLATSLGLDYDVIKDALAADKRIGRTHLDAVHQGGRGAGGHCFIKDMAAFAEIYNKKVKGDKTGKLLLKVLQQKNIEYLTESGKDLDLLKGVYGK